MYNFVKIAENKIIIKNMRNYRGKDIEKIKSETLMNGGRTGEVFAGGTEKVF